MSDSSTMTVMSVKFPRNTQIEGLFELKIIVKKDHCDSMTQTSCMITLSERRRQKSRAPPSCASCIVRKHTQLLVLGTLRAACAHQASRRRAFSANTDTLSRVYKRVQLFAPTSGYSQNVVFPSCLGVVLLEITWRLFHLAGAATGNSIPTRRGADCPTLLPQVFFQ